MKYFSIKLFTVLAFGFASLTFTSCGENSNQEQTEITGAVYACPMDCEKGKTYAQEGECPVCEMDLKEVE